MSLADAQNGGAAAALRPPGLWRAVWLLLRLRALIWISSFRRASWRRKIGMILVALMVVGLMGLAMAFGWMVLNLMRQPEVLEVLAASGAGEPLRSLPTLILSGAFIGLLLTSFGVLLQALYLSGDMDFLISKPLPIRAVFTAKLLQAVLPNFGFVCLFALPALFGLGYFEGYAWPYYPMTLALLSGLALAAAGLASLLVMLVVRIFPARRVAEVLGFLGAIFSILCSQSGQIASWSDNPDEQVGQAFGMLQRLETDWSPLAWAGDGLVRLGQAEWAAGLGPTLGVLALAAAIFGAALLVSENLYSRGWAGMQNRRQKMKRSKRQAAGRWAPLATGVGAVWKRALPPAVRAVLAKDWLVLRRDLRNLSQLVTPLIFGVIYAIMILGRSRPDGPRLPGPSWTETAFEAFMLYAGVGLALLVGWMLLGRLAGMGFAQEGKSYWLLKSAPARAGELIAAKFLVAYLPALALCWLYLLATWLFQRPGFGLLLFALPAVALSLAGNAGINLTFGILGANLAWEDPRQMQRASMGCLGSIVMMVYLPLTWLLFFGPAILAAVLGVPQVIGQTAGLAFGGLVSGVCALGPLWLVKRRVERLGEG